LIDREQNIVSHGSSFFFMDVLRLALPRIAAGEAGASPSNRCPRTLSIRVSSVRLRITVVKTNTYINASGGTALALFLMGFQFTGTEILLRYSWALIWALIAMAVAANLAGANDLKELYELALTRDATLQAAGFQRDAAITCRHDQVRRRDQSKSVGRAGSCAC
jgi:hypothetical protein